MLISLVLLQANGSGLVCAIDCSRVNSGKHVHQAQKLAVHHHSHADHSSAASACCPNSAQITGSMCSQDVQLSAVGARYRISSDLVTAAECPTSCFASSTPSSPIFSSASPPIPLAKPAFSTLRI